MPYSQFKTIAQAKAAFKLTIIEGSRFLPPTPPVAPSQTLSDYLQETLPIVATSGSEKARSEGIIYPVLIDIPFLGCKSFHYRAHPNCVNTSWWGRRLACPQSFGGQDVHPTRKYYFCKSGMLPHYTLTLFPFPVPRYCILLLYCPILMIPSSRSFAAKSSETSLLGNFMILT